MPPFQFYLRLIYLNCLGLSPDFLVEIFYWDINSNLPLRHFDIGSRNLGPGHQGALTVIQWSVPAPVRRAGNINYLYCQIPEMMPVVKPTQDTTPAPPHHSWAQPVNKDRNSSLPEIAREGSQLMPWPWLRFHKIFASEIFSPVPVGFLCYVSLCEIVNIIVLRRKL